jgi:hypothetical protein
MRQPGIRPAAARTVSEVKSVPSQSALRATRRATFERLHAEGRRAVLTGTHQVELAPASGGPRWAVGAVLRPDPSAAAALRAEGCYEAGSTPVLWYVNLVYFTGPVRGADELAAWTEARQQMKVTNVRVTEMQVARWRHTATGMMPVVLASASLS